MPDTTNDTPQPGDGEHIAARRARQGFKDRPILWVLLISMTLLVVAFGVAFMTTSETQLAETPGVGGTEDPAAAGLFDAPSPAPPVVQPN